MALTHKILAFCSLPILASCASFAPAQYGDFDGWVFPNAMIRKNLVLAYEGLPKPIDQVAIVALDARLKVESIESRSGEKIPLQNFSVGPGYFESGTLSQYHLTPGKYTFGMCFIVGDSKNYSTCKSAQPVNLDVQAGTMVQLSLDFGPNSTWVVLRQTPSEASRAKILKDQALILAAPKK